MKGKAVFEIRFENSLQMSYETCYNRKNPAKQYKYIINRLMASLPGLGILQKVSVPEQSMGNFFQEYRKFKTFDSQN